MRSTLDISSKRVMAEEWCAGNIMLGCAKTSFLRQANHFVRYAPEQIEYAKNRYVNETNRLYQVCLARPSFLRLTIKNRLEHVVCAACAVT